MAGRRELFCGLVTIRDGAGLNCAVNRRNYGRKFCGLAAIVMALGIPMAAMYTFFRCASCAAMSEWQRLRVEPDATIAATFGIIPLAVGIGFFVAHALIPRDAKAS